MTDTDYDLLRANLRALFALSRKWTATSYATQRIPKGKKEFITDFISYNGKRGKQKIDIKYIHQIEDDHGLKRGGLLRPDFVQMGSKLIGSFDPDEAEQITELDEEEQPFDPDKPTTKSDFPQNAIVELAARAGMGDGDEAQTVYTKDSQGIRQSDAIKNDYWIFPASFLRDELRVWPKQLIVIECDGDSMEPTLLPGSRVLVDTRHLRPSPDGLYAIRDSFGEIRIKRLHAFLGEQSGSVAVISDNATHPQQIVRLDDLAIVGRVVCALRAF